jgi:hypothetical protein
MSDTPETVSPSFTLRPQLPEIPDRLLRSRWLASTGDHFAWAITGIPTTSSLV